MTPEQPAPQSEEKPPHLNLSICIPSEVRLNEELLRTPVSLLQHYEFTIVNENFKYCEKIGEPEIYSAEEIERFKARYEECKQLLEINQEAIRLLKSIQAGTHTVVPVEIWNEIKDNYAYIPVLSPRALALVKGNV